jgi:hypothetical protein
MHSLCRQHRQRIFVSAEKTAKANVTFWGIFEYRSASLGKLMEVHHFSKGGRR